MRRADIEVPNLPVDVDSWGRSACYPYGNFCPMSHSASIHHFRITKPDFRPCSTCRSHSQAPFCLYTLWLISIQPEGTFGRLRYTFGGDRPSQTPCLKLSHHRICCGVWLEPQREKSGISTTTPLRPKPQDQSLPPILRITNQSSIASSSKAQ